MLSSCCWRGHQKDAEWRIYSVQEASDRMFPRGMLQSVNVKNPKQGQPKGDFQDLNCGFGVHFPAMDCLKRWIL